MTEVRKCAIYARSRHEGVGGIVDQISGCRAEAEARGWSVEEQHIYFDNTREAAIAIKGRPGIQALLKAVNESRGDFDTVIVSDVSRFSRKVNDILAIHSDLSKVGVDVHAFEHRIKPSRHRRRQQRSEACLAQDFSGDQSVHGEDRDAEEPRCGWWSMCLIFGSFLMNSRIACRRC